jgi:hypothetical protein
MVSSKAKTVSIVFRAELGKREPRPSGPEALKGRGLGNPPSSASKLFLVKRAPLVKRVGATEVPAGTRNTVWYGASMV